MNPPRSLGDTLSGTGASSPTIMRILIADDSEVVRRGVRNILAPTSWEICGEAIDGPDAIQKATQLLPDLVLLDISMPGLSGLDVARLLREKVPATSILVMSQHDPSVLLPRALEAGAHACIDKSRLAVDLVPAIERIQAA
jgi:two-component system response regulator NreC